MADLLNYTPHRSSRDNLVGEFATIWDFDVHGGAVGAVNLGLKLPANTVIVGGLIHVLTAVTTGASGTLSFGFNTNVDLLAATAAGSLTLNAALPLLPSYTAALDGNAAAGGVAAFTPIRLTAERELKAAVATGALTAGKVAIYVKYIGPFDQIQTVTYHKAA
jgi:hypothetical protein